MRIISASRRTDIPAFYSRWFMERVREGYALVPNPFNARQVTRVALRPEQVACIAFCTKDPRPMLPHLEELDRLGFRYYFQVTLTGLPRVFEPAVPAAEEVAAAMRELSRRLGRRRVIWRFDPIVLSAVTPEEETVGRFRSLSSILRGITERVVISFVRPYRQLGRRFSTGEVRKTGVRFLDPEQLASDGGRLVEALAEAASANGMTMYSCAEWADLSVFGASRGSCIDANLMREIFGISVSGRKDPGQRGECGCASSVDLGTYGTCPHSCVYCYASRDDRLRRGGSHDPHSPYLVEPRDRSNSPQPQLL